MSNSVQELADLIPDTAPDEVKISTGEAIGIKMIGIGKMPKALKAALPMIDAVKKYVERAAAEKEGLSLLDQAEIIMHIITENGEAVFDFASIVLGKPREWFDDLSPDDFITIAIAWKDRNYDFFIKRILPLLGLAVVNNPPMDGQTQSPSSSETGTNSTTSEDTHSDSSASS